MPRKAAKSKRGPKKGYTQSEAHINKRRIALEKAWASGKFKSRKKRKRIVKRDRPLEKTVKKAEPKPQRLIDTISRRKLKRSAHKIRRKNHRLRKPRRR